MPCMCYYDPPEKSKKLIKACCQMIVEEIQDLRKDGDPLGYEMKDVHTLLDHLYDPSLCKEKDA